MNVNAIKSDLAKFSCDLLVVNCFKDEIPRQARDDRHGGTGAVDKALAGLISREAKERHFEGNSGDTLTIHTHGKIPAKRVMLVGLGLKKDFDLEVVRRVAGKVVRAVRGSGISSIGTILHGAGVGGLGAKDAARALTEGTLLANYEYHKYRDEHRKKQEERGINSLTIVDHNASTIRQAHEGIKQGELGAAGTMLARDLVNEPASICTPAHLADVARKIAKENPKTIKVEIFDRAEAKRRGMGAFLGVTQGAAEEPYFVHLTYRPSAAKLQRKRSLAAGAIAIVGKGITFDSGGLQIKPDTSMQTMKCDMSGCAAVLGLFSVLPKLGIKHEVHGICAITENMPGGKAYKPGDVVRATNGKTIEIGHTDAEGRVTLADSLSFAAKLKPRAIIDLATLTGACMVALGEDIAGIMSNNRKLTADLKRAGDASGEKIWELPMPNEYKRLNKSHIADIKNVPSTRYGGAITAGLFLQEFVGDVPWAHLDIAGPAYAERDNISYVPVGGAGFGVRTLIAYLRS